MTPAKSSILVQHTITPKGSLLQLSKLDLKKITDRTRGCGGQSTHRTHHNKEDSAPKDWNDGWETSQAGKKPGSDRILPNKHKNNSVEDLVRMNQPHSFTRGTTLDCSIFTMEEDDDELEDVEVEENDINAEDAQPSGEDQYSQDSKESSSTGPDSSEEEEEEEKVKEKPKPKISGAFNFSEMFDSNHEEKDRKKPGSKGNPGGSGKHPKPSQSVDSDTT